MLKQIKKTLVVLLLLCFVMSITATAVSANQKDFDRGYRDGYRLGYNDGFKECKTSDHKEQTMMIKKSYHVDKDDYDRGFDRGFDDGFKKGCAAAERMNKNKNQNDFNRGYRDGYRLGYNDGFKECKTSDHKEKTMMIKKSYHIGKDYYDRGFDRGFDDGFKKGCAAAERMN